MASTAQFHYPELPQGTGWISSIKYYAGDSPPLVWKFLEEKGEMKML